MKELKKNIEISNLDLPEKITESLQDFILNTNVQSVDEKKDEKKLNIKHAESSKKDQKLGDKKIDTDINTKADSSVKDVPSKMVYSGTADNKIEVPVVTDPAPPPGYVKADSRKAPSFFTPSLFKRPGDEKAKSERRLMDFEEFLKRINYRTHDNITQNGHGQNLTGGKP